MVAVYCVAQGAAKLGESPVWDDQSEHLYWVDIHGPAVHRFDPQGVTGILAISESHICIHTWPEHGYAAADIFTCGTSFEPRKAAAILIERLESKESSLTELKRGITSEPAVKA